MQQPSPEPLPDDPQEGEATLRDHEARFRTIIDALPHIIWTNDAEGKADYFNQRWYDYTGLTYEQSVGLGWQAVVHPDDATASVERWHRALATGEAFDTEYRLRGADGTYRWYIGRNMPVRNTAGRIIGWSGSATDIEELKQAEVAQRESEELFRLLVEGARDYAMFLLDPDNQITFWSVGAERVFGWSEAEVLGQPGAIIFTQEDRASGAPEREVQVALAEHRCLDRRWHVAKDGSRLFVDGVLIRLDDDDGNLHGFVKIGRDATVQRQAEEALQRARDDLERRVEQRTAELEQEIAERQTVEVQRAALLKRLITAQEDERQRIARELHDSLGQFFTALTVRLSALQTTVGHNLPEVNHTLADALRVASQIDRELDRITMELRPPTLDDLGLVDALRSYVEEWTNASGIPADVVARGLEETRLPGMVETTIYRIAQEALTNVVKHAQATEVSIILERRDHTLRVIIEDNGQGFNINAFPHAGRGGRQVGLIWMAERANLVGGELFIESTPNTGTTIYAHIPLSDRTTTDPG